MLYSNCSGLNSLLSSYPFTPKSVKGASAVAVLVTVTVYIFFVPFSAVTVIVTVFVPTTKSLSPSILTVALLSFATAFNPRVSTVLSTVTA